MIKLFLARGLRLSEMINLKRENMVLQTGKLKVVQGKKSKDKILWINNGTIYSLKDWWERQAKEMGECEYVFTTREGKKLNQPDVRQMVYTFSEKAEITDK